MVDEADAKEIAFFKKIFKGIKKVFKPIGKIAKGIVGSIPFVGKPLVKAGEAIFGGPRGNYGSPRGSQFGGNIGGNVFQGIGSSFGSAFGGAAGGLLANKGSQLLGLTPRPPGAKPVGQQVADTNQFLDGVYPGTTPWERLGVNAGNPMEVAQENQRSGQQQHANAIRAQMAMQATQFGMQRQLQETQLSTQETLKRMEIAASKSIAETQARANVLNGVGTADPAALSGVGQFLRTGEVNPALMKIRGTSAMRHREVVVKEQELINNIERVILQAKEVGLRERQTVLEEGVKPILAEASRLSAQRSGGQHGVVNQLIEQVRSGIQGIIESPGVREWFQKFQNDVRSLYRGRITGKQ